MKTFHFECYVCGAPLADIEVTHPDPDITWNLRAACGHCPDGQSYTQTVNGLFSIVSDDKTRVYSEISDFDMESDPVVIKTVKVETYK